MTTYYTEDHEWVAVEGNVATVGITEHAAEQLGEVVFVELKDEGDEVAAGDEMGVVESVKAASEIFAPVSGTILEANQAIVDAPASVNDSPEGDAWFYRITLSDTAELDKLLDADAYKALIA